MRRLVDVAIYQIPEHTRRLGLDVKWQRERSDFYPRLS